MLGTKILIISIYFDDFNYLGNRAPLDIFEFFNKNYTRIFLITH